MCQVHKAGFCSFLSAPVFVGNLVHICSTPNLSWILLFNARGRRTPSFWVTGTTRFESVDIICQIWPIRGYTRSWYTGTGRLKKWLQAPPPLLSTVSSHFIFVCALSQFSGPDYLGAWSRVWTLSLTLVDQWLDPGSPGGFRQTNYYKSSHLRNFSCYSSIPTLWRKSTAILLSCIIYSKFLLCLLFRFPRLLSESTFCRFSFRLSPR